MKWAIWAVALLGIFPQSAWAGKESHGGDMVICAKSAENSYEGLYSLDYIIGKIQLGGAYPLDEAELGPDPVGRVKDALEKIFPTDYAVGVANRSLVDSWSEYVSLLDNHKDFTKKRIWLPASYGLVNVEDEALINLLPENCLQDALTKQPHAIQAVIRQKPGEAIVYNYSEKMMAEARGRPTQHSFLLTHEWLWDVFEDIRLVRLTNWLIHSALSKNADLLQLRKQLLGVGFGTAKLSWQNRMKISEDLLRALAANDFPAFVNALERGADFKSWVGFDSQFEMHYDEGKENAFNPKLVDERIPRELKEARDRSPAWKEAYEDDISFYRWMGISIAKLAVLLNRESLVLALLDRAEREDHATLRELVQNALDYRQTSLALAMAPFWNKYRRPNDSLSLLGIRRSTSDIPIETLEALKAAFPNDDSTKLKVVTAVRRRDLAGIEEAFREDSEGARLELVLVKEPIPASLIFNPAPGNVHEWNFDESHRNLFYVLLIRGEYRFGADLIEALLKIDPKLSEYFKANLGYSSYKEKRNSQVKLNFLSPLEMALKLRKLVPRDSVPDLDLYIAQLRHVCSAPTTEVNEDRRGEDRSNRTSTWGD